MSCDPHLRQETTVPKYTHKIHARTQISFFSVLSCRCSCVTPKHDLFQKAVSQVSRRDRYKEERGASVQRERESK